MADRGVAEETAMKREELLTTVIVFAVLSPTVVIAIMQWLVTEWRKRRR